jgi:hypothetical protein
MTRQALRTARRVVMHVGLQMLVIAFGVACATFQPPPANGPGAINATAHWFVGGSTPTACTYGPATWTAMSPAGATQTKADPAGDGTSECETITPIEGQPTIACFCTSSHSFTVAPGSWTVTAAGSVTMSCAKSVGKGEITVMNLYPGGCL